ncbi:hypothetical protein ABEF92_007997 [Exophiala dermatitidis]|uniref:F-box domain-containing protein n=2 Tax=Exophiala dermatitidis TaxID=5970 RepID=H6C7B1_EXODN|nr:uncharacterized protein HMPREF1120_07592 [Exophiala dermatitidis NIH/UT8656]EHY59607.1 hypothetical protein HMPREF1120_07592 [Exophiala dermatitidis NIH/UT8656]KAJ4559598.1 hypothetical protein HRR78_000118 [Exophiala dermatitidis]
MSPTTTTTTTTTPTSTPTTTTTVATTTLSTTTPNSPIPPTMALTLSPSPSVSSSSSASPTFMDLPPEVRNLIYTFAFQSTEPMRLRNPSERRLRPARPPKDDARGLVDTCRLVRHESISLYYSVNALVFRSTQHVLAFISDPNIHPLIRSSVTHIAVDFGDSTNADIILKDHINLVDSCIGTTLPRLKALETRFYARTMDSCSSSHFHTLAMAFDGLDADMNARPSPRWPRSPRSSIAGDDSDLSSSSSSSSSCPSPCSELMDFDQPQPQPDLSTIQAEVLEQYCFTPSAAVAFAKSKLKFSVAATSHDYPGHKHDKLICYNLRIGVDGLANALGPAEDAVKQRVSRVGIPPRNLSDMYDTTADSGFHQRVRATMASCSRIDVGVS